MNDRDYQDFNEGNRDFEVTGEVTWICTCGAKGAVTFLECEPSLRHCPGCGLEMKPYPEMQKQWQREIDQSIASLDPDAQGPVN